MRNALRTSSATSPFAMGLAAFAIGSVVACGSSDNPESAEGGTDASSAFDTAPGDALPIDAGPQANAADVLEYHKHASRDGVYVDALMTKAAAGTLHRDAAFHAPVDGWIMAQPLYVEAGANGKPTLYVTTETNMVYALDASTGSVIWKQQFPAAIPVSDLSPCGNINPLGITGTPIIDLASRTIFFDAMTAGPKHLLFALSIDDGTTRAGWPIDTTTIPATTASGSVTLDGTLQNERGALALFNGSLYVPYGGHIGDCGNYHGWVIGVPIADPTKGVSWATDSLKSGIWAPSGIASDGVSLLVTTGNASNSGGAWRGSEGVIRLKPGPTFSKASVDYFVPSNWVALDNSDADISGTGPIPFDLPGSTPSALVAAFGKNGVVYLVDRSNFGGIGTGNGETGEAVVSKRVSSSAIVNGSAVYTTSKGTYFVFRGKGIGCPNGTSGDLTAVKVTAGSPPSLEVAWCASQGGSGSPIVTLSSADPANADAIVWVVGAEQSNQLQGFDGDTGAVIRAGLDAGTVHRYETVIDVKGRIFVGAEGELIAFTP